MKIPGFFYYLGFRILFPLLIGGGVIVWALFFGKLPEEEEKKIFDNYVRIGCDVYARDKSQTEEEVITKTITELQEKMDLSNVDLNLFLNSLEDTDNPDSRIYELMAKWVDCGFQKLEDFGIIKDKDGELILDPNFKYEEWKG